MQAYYKPGPFDIGRVAKEAIGHTPAWGDDEPAWGGVPVSLDAQFEVINVIDESIAGGENHYGVAYKPYEAGDVVQVLRKGARVMVRAAVDIAAGTANLTAATGVDAGNGFKAAGAGARVFVTLINIPAATIKAGQYREAMVEVD